MQFLRRYRVLVSATALLLLSLFLLSMSVRSTPYRDPLAEVVLVVFAPLQGATLWVRRGVERGWFGYVHLIGVAAENEHLRERVAGLEADVVRLGEMERAHARLADMLAFRSELRAEVRGARVIARDPQHWFRSLVIDLGGRDGLRPGMAVLAPGGVVGRVLEVARTSSRVMLLTDNDSGVAAIVQRTRAEGIVHGARDQGCRMNYLRRDVDVSLGDRVVTSGLDGIFPKGILIGEITEVVPEHRDLLLSARVKPSVSLGDLEEVLVVLDRGDDGEP